MPEIVTISSNDSNVYNEVMDYFNLLPLPSRTNLEALAIFKSKVEEYERDRGDIPESWSCLNRLNVPKHTNTLVHLFEQIEKFDNRDDLLSGEWTQLVKHLSSLVSIVSFGTVANTRGSNMLGVKNALLGIADAMNELNRALELNLPKMAIQ